MDQDTRDRVGSMDIRHLAGQRLMAGFDGTDLNDDVRYLIKTLRIGGLILFSQNIRSIGQTRTLVRDAQDYARENRLPPLFIAVDQEGGAVVRFKEPFTRFRGNPHIHTTAQARDFARTVSDELLQVGVNMNMAPVMDVVYEPGSVMADRAFPGGPDAVGRLGSEVIRTMQANGVMAVAKHFPGIGRTKKDSHFELPVLPADRDLILETDLFPFVQAKAAGVAGMMLSHILYSALDPVWPASLSPKIASELLRNTVQYPGVVMTDDLDMKAIRHDMPTIIRQVLQASVDIVLICHKGPNIQAACDRIIHHLSDDPEMLRKGRESAERILAVKSRFLSGHRPGSSQEAPPL